MADYGNASPAGRRVKQGQLFEQGCQFLTSEDETAQIPWPDVACLVLGKIEPTRTVSGLDAPGPVKGVAGLVARGVGGANAWEGMGGVENSGAAQQSAYFVLDVYARGDAVPFRIDSVSTNLRKFLGEEAGYSGEINLVNLIRRLAQGAPQALDISIQTLLEKGKASVPGYPDLDAFRIASARAATRIGQVGTVSPIPVAQALPPEAPVASAPQALTGFGSTVAPISAGLQPVLLTGAYMIGLFFLIIGAKLRVSKADGFEDILYWIFAGAFLSMAGLATIKGRNGDLRDYLQHNIPILRGWLLCAAVGSLLFGLFMGFTAYTLGQGVFTFSAAEGGIGRGGARGFTYLALFVVACAVGCLIAFALGINLVFLALAREDQILDAPTVLDFIGLE